MAISSLSYIRLCPGEKQLIRILSEKIVRSKNNILLRYDEKLNEGDTIIGTFLKKHTPDETVENETETETETEIPYICLERKSASDLLSSRKGTRYDSQNAKLKLLKPLLVGYIVEKNTALEEQIEPILWSLTYKHGMIVQRSKSIEDTCDIILRLASRVVEYQKIKDNECTASLKVNATKKQTQYMEYDGDGTKVKKQSISKDSFFIQQLCLCCSKNVATSIQKKYSTMQALQSAWRSSENPSVMLVGLQSTANRCIGKITSDSIYQSLYIKS